MCGNQCMNNSYVCAVLNSSHSEAAQSEPRFYSTGCLLIPVTVFGLVGSGVCAYKLRRNSNPSLSISIDVLFYGMSTLSFLLSLLVLPFHIYTTLAGPVNFLATVQYRPLCSVIGFLLMLTTQAAVSYHGVIALHRFFVVVLSEKWPKLRSNGVLIVLAAVPWVEAVLFNIWPFFHMGAEFGYNCMTDRCMLATTYSPKYHMFVRMATPAIAFPVMLACYSAICWKVFRFRSRFVRPKNSIATAGKKTVRRLKHAWLEMKVTKVAFVACLTFSACYLPVTIRTLFVKRYEDMYSQVGNSVGILNWLGCTLGPWVTVYLNGITHAKGSPSPSNSAAPPPATAELIPSRKTTPAVIPGKPPIDERHATGSTSL